MILYFADRQMNILDHASTELLEGLVVSDDRKTETVETGVAVFECKVHFDDATREKVEAITAVGNYILRSNGDEQEFYTIIESEANTKKQTVYIYAEDAGLDLLNEVVGPYEADKAYSIAHYIETFAYDSGFRIGVNEAASLTRKLVWDGEETVTSRLASVAKQFDGCEISFSFAIKGLSITNKFINIHKKRGQDNGVTLRLNRDIDSIITSKSIVNIATALRCEGGTPDDADKPITLRGYVYDDGDFYVDGDTLKSRTALKQWSRYVWSGEPNTKPNHEGHIVKLFSYDTTEQKTLCSRAITELKTLREIEVNYEVDISVLPDGVKVGDRVNIVDEAGELYLSTRILQLESCVCEDSHKAVLGEHLIKTSGIHQKVAELAQQFAKQAQSAARALELAKAANAAATEAKSQVDEAIESVEEAQKAVAEVTEVVEEAKQSAAKAQAAADAAQAVVDGVEDRVGGLETTVANAKQAADNAQAASITAEIKANEAAKAAAEAKAEAADANASVAVAVADAQTAVEKAESAESTAAAATQTATDAKSTADAAKADAAKAKEDIASLGDSLATLSNTMSAEYARKTELSEAEASLTSKIEQNAAQISTTVSRLETVDETANNAAEQAAAAQTTADEAKAKAEAADADARAAQTAADNAAQAAANAQSEADKAQTAAATAKGVADKAEADLAAAQASLATVQSRVDATEAEILAAQQAVETAQAAADKAKADASAAATAAAEAKGTADKAVEDASTAQTVANNAAEKADLAKQVADAAQGDATAAITKAEEAQQTAINAQNDANTAKTNAEAAQAQANTAAEQAAQAQRAAEDADAKAAAAQTDLNTAKQNLANVTSRVGATEEEVEAAKAAVAVAQNAADKAQEEAETAQAAADAAKADAATAQAVADNARTAADNAQAAANAAQQAADEAQAAVDTLAVRVTSAETQIIQNSEQIGLMATREEVTETLGGYYTKEETDAALEVKSDSVAISLNKQITSQVGTVDGKFEEFKSDFNKRIEFSSETAITIGSDKSAITLEIDNEKGVSFKENGEAFGTWNGKALLAETVMFRSVPGSSGDFGFFPMSDGSLKFTKVGG